ncbi:hypothetical protein E2562_036856 [Oryza meyeriana var. granulata]|uniref:Reverse transcriptase zinc-binding domain-containing protein n=1 Tax=Oryza meyeriana var. granulata TaxID=110450 RepID=A0A6G1E9Z9_9ORYZ|nr:hypothetical protein E2562_036856 [Oryza meyeriana var. granulata]
MTAIKLPKHFLQQIDKARHKFLWAGREEIYEGKCKVNWAKVCLPIKYEGLGIPDLQKIGRALRLCWLWHQWTSLDKPWVGMSTPCDDIDRKLFAASTEVVVGDGTKASF